MDPTLAALCGTVIGAAATALVPFITIRARRRDESDARRREDTVALLDAVVRWLKARRVNDWRLISQTHSEAIVALERLLINANKNDVDHLQRVTNFVFNAAAKEHNVYLGAASAEAMSEVLRRWCRGELKGMAIEDAYGPALDIQLAKQPSNS